MLLDLIKKRLHDAFIPTLLEVIDDSAQHVGHAGSANGAGHFTVIIQANCFHDRSRIMAHRMIYAELNDLIPEKIHALKIQIK